MNIFSLEFFLLLQVRSNAESLAFHGDPHIENNKVYNLFFRHNIIKNAEFGCFNVFSNRLVRSMINDKYRCITQTITWIQC